jgi:hypothetical protein
MMAVPNLTRRDPRTILATADECREAVAAKPLCHPALMSMDRQAAFLAAFVRTTAPAVAVAA